MCPFRAALESRVCIQLVYLNAVVREAYKTVSLNGSVRSTFQFAPHRLVYEPINSKLGFKQARRVGLLKISLNFLAAI